MGGGGGVLLDGCHILTLFGWIRAGVAGLWFDQGWTLWVSVQGRGTYHVGAVLFSLCSRVTILAYCLFYFLLCTANFLVNLSRDHQYSDSVHKPCMIGVQPLFT